MTLEMHVLVWAANIAGLNWLIESQPTARFVDIEGFVDMSIRRLLFQ
jgi:hypothetical protein